MTKLFGSVKGKMEIFVVVVMLRGNVFLKKISMVISRAMSTHTQATVEKCRYVRGLKIELPSRVFNTCMLQTNSSRLLQHYAQQTFVRCAMICLLVSWCNKFNFLA